MPLGPATRRTLTAAVGVALSALLMCAELSARAQAQTSATITASLSPDRLDAKGALTLTIHFTPGSSEVPSAARRSVLMLPAGLGLNIPTLHSCSAARVRARGASGCPAQSKIGSGHALVEGEAGSELVSESISVSVFLGPLHGFQPTFEVLGEGFTPLRERVVFAGTVSPATAPYGEELVISVPPIPTLPLEPDASLSTLTLTVGTNTQPAPREANTVVMPGSCPTGGFPFAAEFTYADGSTGSALTTAPCPQQTKAG
jgi:hypothetical protein